jgi:hypothetical protein
VKASDTNPLVAEPISVQVQIALVPFVDPPTTKIKEIFPMMK